MTPYSQRDTRWKDVEINGTKLTIGTDGCYLTCLGMVTDTTPDWVVKKIGFNGAQINYTGLDKIGLELVEKSNTYDDVRVKEHIANNGFCVVRVDWDGSPKSTEDTHFVLFIGNKRMIDPWTGNECATTKYPLLTGYRAFKKVGNMDALAECLSQHTKLVDETTQLKKTIEAIKSEEEAYKVDMNNMKLTYEETIGKLRVELEGKLLMETQLQQERDGRREDSLKWEMRKIELMGEIEKLNQRLASDDLSLRDYKTLINALIKKVARYIQAVK